MVISKIVYSKKMYNKFIIEIKSHSIASKDMTSQQNVNPRNYSQVLQQPAFVLTGYCQKASVVFHPTTLYYYELLSLLKVFMVKEIIPSYKCISHIRTLEEFCNYLLFPFMQVYIPSTF